MQVAGPPGLLGLGAVAAAVPGSIGRDVLFYLGLQTLTALMAMTASTQRNTLISHAATQTTTPIPALQALTTDAVAAAVLAQSVLLRGGVVGRQQLAGMSIGDQRNTLIVANSKRLGGSVPMYQALSTYNNSRLAWGWYLGDQLGPFMSPMAHVAAGEPLNFQTHTLLPAGSPGGQRIVGTDCLSMYWDAEAGLYVGAFHTLRPKQSFFDVYVATSPTLANWTTVALLRERASMAKVYADTPMGGVLLLFECNTEGYGPSVGAAWYSTAAAFRRGAPAASTFVSNRTLSQYAEGTPNLLAATGQAGTVSGSSLSLGMHYFKDGVRDQQALATLDGFSTWTASAVIVANEWQRYNGVEGKVGDRSAFQYRGRRWLALESQLVLDSWSSWRVFVGDGLGYAEVQLRTPGGSKSFANPFVKARPGPAAASSGGDAAAQAAALACRRHHHQQDGGAKPWFCGSTGSSMRSTGSNSGGAYMATIFIPSQGSAPGEAGDLVYSFTAGAGDAPSASS